LSSSRAPKQPYDKALGDDPHHCRSDQDICSAGVGVLYFLIRDMGLWLGIDVARGPEDWYTYILVG